MHQRNSRNSLIAALILALFIGAFVADMAMPSNPDVVQANGAVGVVGMFIVASIGGVIYVICKKDDPDRKKKIADFWDRNRER